MSLVKEGPHPYAKLINIMKLSLFEDVQFFELALGHWLTSQPQQ